MTMPGQIRLLLAVATLSAASVVCAAQTADQPGQVNSNSEQQQAAPIERAYPNHAYARGEVPQPIEPAEAAPLKMTPGQTIATKTLESVMPIEGVLLRVGADSSVKEVASDAQKLELSVEHGLVNVNVLDPAEDILILVDLPGGQTQVLKNGLYTFNAETNTARVLKGEALAFPVTAVDKPIKVKEYNKVVFGRNDVRPREFYPEEVRTDLLRGPRIGPPDGGGPGGLNGYWPSGDGYGPYGDGFYGSAPYPYYGYGYPYAYPWGWGYPYYAWGYPFGIGIGFGFGYYGGWGYGGFGYRGGWGYRGWR